MYPAMIDVRDKEAAVIGGGKVAYRKILPLLEARANITVISPQLTDEIEQLYLLKKIKVKRKEVEPEDYKSAFLIIAATDSIEINRSIAANVSSYQLINVVNDPDRGNFHVPASMKRGKLVIAVSTSGASPHFAKHIRDELAVKYDSRYKEYVDFLDTCRKLIKSSSFSHMDKSNFLLEILDQKYLTKPVEREKIITELQKNNT